MSYDIPTVEDALADFDLARAEYAKFVRTQRQRSCPLAVPRELSEKLFLHAATVMLAYQHPRNWPDGHTSKPLHPFPVVLSGICCVYILSLMAGKLPGPIEQLLRRGTPAIGPEESRDIGRAVVYIDAVRQNVIQDRHAIKTVADAFVVDRRTVQRWVKAQKTKGVTWRVFGADRLPDSERGASIRRDMEEAGARYRVWARAASKRPRGTRSK